MTELSQGVSQPFRRTCGYGKSSAIGLVTDQGVAPMGEMHPDLMGTPGLKLNADISVRGKALDGDPDARVEDVMEAGPTTVRTNEPLEPLYQRMVSREVESLLVTTSDGRLVGSLFRADVERVLNDGASSQEEDEASCLCSA